MKPIVLVNKKAGTALQLTGEPLDARIGRAFAEAGQAADVRRIPPRQLVASLKAARQADRPVIIAGGDGSVAAAVQVFAGTGVPLGVIPLGTLNLLAHDLGMPTDIEEAVKVLATQTVSEADLGRVGDRYFHSMAGFGFLTRLARQRASLREEMPGAKRLAYLIATLRSYMSSGNFDVEIDDGRERHSFRTPAMVVTNNLFVGASWRRERLDAGLIEVNVARGDIALGLLRGGLAAVLGSWRGSEGVATLCASRLTFRFKRPRVFMSFDGEMTRPRTPLVFESVPGALTCLVPPPASSEE